MLTRKVAMKLAATEYGRIAEAAANVAPDEWRNATDCEKWDVHALTGHVLGMAEMAASMREEARQRKTTIKLGGEYIDTLTDLHVREHAGLEPAELTARLGGSDRRQREVAGSHPGSSDGAQCPCPGCTSTVGRSGGLSGTCWTSSSPVTRGCTGSTWAERLTRP